MEAAGCWVCECTEMVVCGESVGSRLRLRALTDHRFAYSPFRVKSRETDDKTCLASSNLGSQSAIWATSRFDLGNNENIDCLGVCFAY